MIDFLTVAEHSLESAIDSALADLRGKGFCSNVLKDDYRTVSPPEVATWTGKNRQLALARSGRNSWLEVRAFLPENLRGPGSLPGRTALLRCTDRIDFAQTVMTFAQGEGE